MVTAEEAPPLYPPGKSRPIFYFQGLLQLLVTKEEADGTIQRGRLTLVDLAGSERQQETEVTGMGFREACYINQSLFVLRKVITALATPKDDKVYSVQKK